MDDDPFASEHEEEETWPYSMQSTGILMLSLPDSLEDQITPPEHRRTQSISSSGDLVPVIAIFDLHTVRTIDGGGDAEMLAVDSGCTDAERTVDLGKDSDALGFSEPKLVKGIEGMDAGRTTDFSKNSDTLVDIGSEKNMFSESPIVYAGETNTIVIKSESIEIGEAHILDSGFEENHEGLGAWLSKNKLNVDKLVKGTKLGCGDASSDIAGGNGVGPSANKNIDDIDKSKYVACGGADKCGMERGVLRRHDVQGSLKEKEKNDGLWVPRVSLDKYTTFKELLNALGISVDDSEDTDFLETAKKHGLIFPRPRWWPLEGFDDHVVD